MITRIVKMNFRPEEVENFLNIFHQSKDKIRHMPGCKHLELWNSQSDASIY
jgi:quinol monooxygenase YgiN